MSGPLSGPRGDGGEEENCRIVANVITHSKSVNDRFAILFLFPDDTCVVFVILTSAKPAYMTRSISRSFVCNGSYGYIHTMPNVSHVCAQLSLIRQHGRLGSKTLSSILLIV